MSRAYSTYGRKKMCIKGFGRDTCGKPRLRWEDNIKMNFQKLLWVMNWLGMVQDRERCRACECGNVPSGSINCKKFLD